MKRFAAKELRTFLVAVGRSLQTRRRMIVIGGSAAALAHGFFRATRDIDTWSPIDSQLSVALERARAETGLDIPVEHVTVAEAPWDFEDRLETIELRGAHRLDVFVPEPHDLVLMKCLRGYQHDLEAALAIHRSAGLLPETLVVRYQREMAHVTGDPARLDLNLLAVVDHIFGEDEAERIEKRLRDRQRAPTTR